MSNINNIPEWLIELEDKNIFEILFLEKDDISYNFDNIKNNLIIINPNDFNELLSNYLDLKLGSISQLLNKLPKTECFKNLQTEYTEWDRYSSYTRFGISKYLSNIFLNQLIREPRTDHIPPSKLFVIGTNLVFNNVSELKDIQYKNTKAIVFSYIENLNVFVFFKDSYWENIREPINLTFNKFIKSESVKVINEFPEIPEENIIIKTTSEKKKKSFLFF